MSEKECAKLIKNLLRRLGVSNGDVIYLGLDMGRLPLPRWTSELNSSAMRKREWLWCEFLFENIMEVLGPKGTLLLGTFTYSCSNSSVPFVLEDSPSEIGSFTNWLRQHSGAIRSVHPIFSVAGVGAHASDILSDAGSSAFGPCSPFGKLAPYNTRFVNLGISLSKTLTYIHHLEQCYGCHHRYNKVIPGKVFVRGKEVERDFYGFMRWRGVDLSVNVDPLEDNLRNENLLLEVYEKDIFGQSALVSDIDRIGYEMLSKNSCSFIKSNARIYIDDSAVQSAPSKKSDITFKLSFDS